MIQICRRNHRFLMHQSAVKNGKKCFHRKLLSVSPKSIESAMSVWLVPFLKDDVVTFGVSFLILMNSYPTMRTRFMRNYLKCKTLKLKMLYREIFTEHYHRLIYGKKTGKVEITNFLTFSKHILTTILKLDMFKDSITSLV
jgi:hypothetical protein